MLRSLVGSEMCIRDRNHFHLCLYHIWQVTNLLRNAGLVRVVTKANTLSILNNYTAYVAGIILHAAISFNANATINSAMAERPRVARRVGNFKGCVTLTLNFRLRGYVSRQYLWVSLSVNFIRKGRCPSTTVGVRKLE